MNVSKKTFFLFSLLILISVLIHTLLYTQSNQDITIISNNLRGIDTYQPGDVIDNYLENKSQSTDRWLSLMAIMSTIFAVFFVYAGFRIEDTKNKIIEAKNSIKDTEKRVQEDILEYGIQLEYSMSYIVQKQYDKAIDALTVLRHEHFVLKDDRKINTCNYFLAHCHYERGLLQNDEGDLAMAVNYIDYAIEDPNHPLKKEIINAFEKISSDQKHEK
jgi:tetratricopeptide (TPR) repeat protein